METLDGAQKVDLSTWSEIESQLELVKRGAANVLLVRFAGAYPDGSRGSKDAKFMRAKVAEGIAGVYPDALVLDLRKLSYRWGDNLISVLDACSHPQDDPEDPLPLPLGFVGSESCEPALLSLLGFKTATDWPSYSRDMESTITRVAEEFERWLNED